jgi:hypothetical protein
MPGVDHAGFRLADELAPRSHGGAKASTAWTSGSRSAPVQRSSSRIAC